MKSRSSRSIGFDIEGNDLYLDVTIIHCAAALVKETGERFFFGPGEIGGLLDLLDTATTIYGHNILDYDIPALINPPTAKNIPTVYIALVLDKQTNAAQADSELVFTNPGASAVTAASPLRNMQYTSRFEVLDSVCLEIEQPQATYDGTNLEQAGSRTPFKLSWTGDLMTQYVGTAATVASIQDNSLHVIAYAGPDLTAAPVISYNSRVRFVG